MQLFLIRTFTCIQIEFKAFCESSKKVWGNSGIPQNNPKSFSSSGTGKFWGFEFKDFWGQSPKFPKIRGRGKMNNYLALWGQIGDRESQVIGEFWGSIPQKYLNVGLGTGTKFLGNLQTLVTMLF